MTRAPSGPELADVVCAMTMHRDQPPEPQELAQLRAELEHARRCLGGIIPRCARCLDRRAVEWPGGAWTGCPECE